jgi:hypothetical protein
MNILRFYLVHKSKWAKTKQRAKQITKEPHSQQRKHNRTLHHHFKSKKKKQKKREKERKDNKERN